MADPESPDPHIISHHDDQADHLPRYQYQPLSPTRRSIRLLEILPPSPTTPLLSCTLKEVFLDTNPPSYKALSYTWDTTFFDCTILINGAPLRIGRNLWFFLAYAGQLPQDIGPLWIDAICIDQANGAERNKQVAMMRQIYSDADEGIVWLGADDETVDLCARVIAYGYEEKLAVHDAVPPDALGLLNEFFARIAYWKRLWIVQEFILARRVSVWCGHLVVDLGFFLLLPESAYLDLMPEAMLVRFLITMRTMWHFPLGEPAKDVFALKELLTATAESKSTVVIDRVYGLLGLALDVEASKYPIGIDYSKTPAEVFMDVIRNRFQDRPFDRDAMCNYVAVLLPNLGLEIEDVVPALEVMYPEFSCDMYHQYLLELTIEGNEATYAEYAEYAEWARTLE